MICTCLALSALSATAYGSTSHRPIIHWVDTLVVAHKKEFKWPYQEIFERESEVRSAPTTRLLPEERKVSINVIETELSIVLNELSDATGANLILLGSPNIKITLRMSELPLIEMIRHICAVTNLQHLKVGNTIAIATAEQLQKGYPKEWAAEHPLNVTPTPALPITVIYYVNHADSARLAETLKNMFEGKGLTVSVGPATNVPSIHDQQTSQVTGVSSGTLQSGDPATKDSRTIILHGPEEVVQEARQLAKNLDYARPQVSIGVTIHDVSNEALKELGLSWSYSDISITESTPRGINFGAFSRAPLSFTGKIKALERSDKAKLLASPNISVLDGERGFILIGSRLNFPVLVGYTQANTPIYDRQEERVGIYLQVAARVGDDGQITLSLYPQVSTVTGFLEVNGASYPQISTREAQTSLRVRDGELIVMGGMLKDEEIHQIEKVPLLAEIPILGELFKRRKTTKVASQVIITIQPLIIHSDK